MLDTMMEVAVWHLLDLPLMTARSITQGMNADRKLTWLKVLAEKSTLTPAERVGLAGILGQIKANLEWRNRVIHGLWHIGDNGRPWVAKFNEKGKLTWHGALAEAEIQPIAGRIKKLANELADWLSRRDPAILDAAFPRTSTGRGQTQTTRSRRNPPSASPTKRATRQRQQIPSRA